MREAALYVVERCMGVKPSETVLVIADDEKVRIGQETYAAARKAGAEALFMIMKERRESGEEPPAPVAAAMLGADVILMPTSRSLSHTQARRSASAKGARTASMPGITEDMMTRCLRGVLEEIVARSAAVAEMLTRSKEARISSSAGTDLWLSIEGREGVADDGLLDSPGAFGNLPAGEASVGPVEGAGEGILVIDGSILGEIVDEPVRVTIREGRAEKIEGKRSASRLERALEAAGPLAVSVAEAGIGTNPQAVITGKVLEDEKVLGTVHVAFGNNKSDGGSIDVPIHVDGVLLRPSLWIDGVEVIRDGRFTLDFVRVQ